MGNLHRGGEENIKKNKIEICKNKNKINKKKGRKRREGKRKEKKSWGSMVVAIGGLYLVILRFPPESIVQCSAVMCGVVMVVVVITLEWTMI